MSKNLKKQWRVECRLSRNHKWRKAGLFETRSAARADAAWLREELPIEGRFNFGYGFGNTRVVPYVKGQK